MKVELRTITPEVAKKMLESNRNNRPICASVVKYLAKEMSNGKWRKNGETISFSDNRLMDGQHRLMAVIKSGVTIKSLVVGGLADDVFESINTGKRRSASDVLSCTGEVNTRRLAAALAMIERYYTSRMQAATVYSNTEIKALLDKHPGVRDSIKKSHASKTTGLILPAVLDSCHYLFSQKDADAADDFIHKLVTGTGLQEGEPYYCLRERLIRNSLSKTKITRVYMMALCIKAWNAERQGSKLGTLKFAEGESFPIIR
jgi:hypothetical protein